MCVFFVIVIIVIVVVGGSGVFNTSIYYLFIFVDYFHLQESVIYYIELSSRLLVWEYCYLNTL